jgi:hypothetical protein
MGNSQSNEKTPTIPEYLQSTLLNNITIFTTMAIIYIFISADRSASYTSMDQFMFMNLITNPHPCDKSQKPKKPADKEKNAAPAGGLGAAISGALGAVGGPAEAAALIQGAMGAKVAAGTNGKGAGTNGKGAGTNGKGAGTNAGATAAAGTNAGPTAQVNAAPVNNKGPVNAPSANKPQQGGGTVSEDLLKVASSLNNVGQAINSFTADVKADLDFESYKVETLSRHKETYCNDMDDMGMFGAFFFILHSSFLASYNAIQMVNESIVRIIYFKTKYLYLDGGIMLLYLLFFIVTAASTSFIEFITQLIDPSVSLTDSFTRQLVLSIFSALISLFFIYFMIGTVAYLEYLIYGMVNIKSEQSSTTFKVIYAIFLFVNIMITIPSIFGVNLV